MPGYHIHPDKGAKRCYATTRRCPYGGETGREDHYSTQKEAQSVFDEAQQKKHGSLMPMRREPRPGDPNYVYRKGMVRPKHERFATTPPARLADMRALAERDAALVLSYRHTYEPQRPEERPGEADYLATYDLASFAGRDTSSDMVVLKPAAHGRSLEVLMVLRGNHPYKDTWAHPGGFLNYNEPIVAGATREAGEEANMKLPEADVEYVGHYDHPDRDPRGAVKMNVSMTFVPIGTTPRAGDDAKQSRFIPLAKIFDGSYPICGDHRLSIRDAVAHLLNVDVPPAIGH